MLFKEDISILEKKEDRSKPDAGVEPATL
ncbi:unnamed protein product [Priceomyces carsonii]|nr:unnamed protein product [Priceomyces carsonii]